MRPDYTIHRKPDYMIHTIPEREYYVRGYLIPSMTAQGIPRSRIKIWSDKDHLGNLLAYVASYAWCGEKKKRGATWHLNDDVLISKDFAFFTENRAADYPELEILNCFCPDRTYDDDRSGHLGPVNAYQVWYSSPCVRLNDELAGGFAKWFMGFEGSLGPACDALIREGKGDDTLLHVYLERERPDVCGYNMLPNLVQHIDDLLDGSVCNKERPFPIRAKYWEEQGETEDVKRWLERRAHEET